MAMNKQKDRLSITMNGVKSCSGSCYYCIAGRTNKYKMSITELEKIDEITSKEIKWDFDRLERVLKERKPKYIDIWGADPISCFTNLVTLYDMIKEVLPKARISSSTNGLPLKRNDITNWIIENDISIQLSHDGLGQNRRTHEDPLDFDNVRKLMRLGKLSSINCTLTGYNNSLYKNMDYFNSKLKEIFPEIWDDKIMASEELSNIYKRLYIKLNHIMDGEYEDKNIILSGRSLDDYLFDWDVYFEKWRTNRVNDLYHLPFNKYLIDQFKRGRDVNDDNCNECRKFQIGVTNVSTHIDTLGLDCDCNLMDSDHPVLNRENAKREYCNNCRFEKSGECNMCGAVPKRIDKCEYFYRWNQFLCKTRGVLYGKSSSNSRSKCRVVNN